MFQTFFYNAGNSVSSWELLGVVTKSTLILIFASVVCWLLRRNSAAIRHRIWTLGIVSTLLIPFICNLLPQLSIAILPRATVDSMADNQSIGHSCLENRSHLDQAATTPLVEIDRSTSGRDAGEEPQRFSSTMPRESVSLLSSSQASVFEQRDTPNLILLLWGIGSAVVILPFLGAIALQWLRQRDFQAIDDPEWTKAIEKFSSKIEFGPGVKAYESKLQRIPAVYGALFPYLVMPIGWRQWSDTQLECVLLHELAHLKRRDVAAQYLGRIAAAAYWFNPLAWYALRQLRIERELACDDWVLQTGTRASDYASQLVQTCRMARWLPLDLGVAMTHSARLEDRIIAVLDGARCRVRPTRSICWLATSLMLLVTIAIGVPVLVAGPTSQSEKASNAKGNGEKAVDPAIASATSRKHETMTFRGQVLHGATPIEGATISLYQRYIAEGFYKDWHPRETLDIEPKTVALSGKNGEFEFSISSADLVDSPKNIWPNSWNMIQVVASRDGMGVGWCNVQELKDRKKIWIRNTAIRN